MSYDLERSRNVMTCGAAWSGAWAPLTTADLQPWFGSPATEQRSDRETRLRCEERRKERARIARELHDTLFQGFLGVSMVLHRAVETMPEDSPSKPPLSRALVLMRRVIDEGRDALLGLRAPESGSWSLEQALAEVADEFERRKERFRIRVMGPSRALDRGIQEQIFLIMREALVNAAHHSGATSIEAEVEYLPNKIRVVVRDNGCGIDQEVLRSGRDAHWGLLGMRERANSIGGQLRIWSSKKAGTELEISVPGDARSVA
jgi:signal transduction histidine kinase